MVEEQKPAEPSGEEIGRDESWFANVKRLYDEFLHESLESIRRNRSYLDKVLSDAQQSDNVRQNIANQGLQNAVETANMLSKQALRHGDFALDRQWNIDEVAQLVAKTPVFLDAISAAVAAAVNASLAGKGSV
jgi:hypothetical protein